MARLTNLTERGLETEYLIRDVLMSLILEKGYEHVSIKDITERAGVDRTTFYLHFKDKDDLFEKSQRWMVDDLMELRSMSGVPYPGIRFVFEHMAANRERYLAIYKAEGSATSVPPVQDYIVRSMMPMLEAQLAERGIKAGDDLEPLTRYFAGAFRGLARWWLESGASRSPAELSALFMRLTLRGMESFLHGVPQAPL